MAEIAAVPGRILGSDIEDQAAAAADAAERLAGYVREPTPGPLDAAAALGCLGRADVSLKAATAELTRHMAERPPG